MKLFTLPKFVAAMLFIQKHKIPVFIFTLTTFVLKYFYSSKKKSSCWKVISIPRTLWTRQTVQISQVTPYLTGRNRCWPETWRRKPSKNTKKNGRSEIINLKYFVANGKTCSTCIYTAEAEICDLKWFYEDLLSAFLKKCINYLIYKCPLSLFFICCLQ